MEPLRTCIGCGMKKPQDSLIRIVRDAAGNISVNTGRKADGRGAYVCRDLKCVKRMCDRRGLNRDFRMAAEPEATERIRQTLNQMLADNSESYKETD